MWVPIALLAFVARLLPTLHGGGLRGMDDYDEGVYFSAAQALIAGRFPYRDFVLLHPPGIVLVLTPFAALARVVSDHRAFELARLAFMALGSINAVLTAAIARRARSGGVIAAAVAGVLYAVWPPAIDAESTTLLTPWSTLGMLLALLLLYRRSARPHEEFLAGVALGAAAAVKIWGVVPLVVVLAWELIRGRGGETARVACGAAAGVTAVCLPFFLAAPGPMFRMVVVDQLERGEANAGVRGRISGILGVARFGSGARPPHLLVVAAVAVLCALAVVGAVLDRAWLVSALLVAIVTLLLTAPSFFAHYAGYAAAPLLVLTGTGAAALAVPPCALAVPGTGKPSRPDRGPRRRRHPDHGIRLRRRRAPPRHPIPRCKPGQGSGLEPLRHGGLARGPDPDGSAESRPGTTVSAMDRCHGPDVRHRRGAAPER